MKRFFCKSTLALALVLGFALGVTGCQGPLGQLAGELNAQWNGLVRAIMGLPSGSAETQAPGPASTRTLNPSQNALRAKENSEILQEVLRVVYNREPGNRAEFGNLVDSMNQGASIEGLYNGFTHSSDYRRLEAENPGAKSGALVFFASELARTETELKPPTEFGPDAAGPLPLPETPGGAAQGQDDGTSTGVSEISFGGAASAVSASPSAAPQAPSIGDLEAGYRKTFAGASIFTLKRVLGDEMLKLVAQKSRDPKGLQSWYGAWVARMCGESVDFGLPDRNRADAAFHARWAATADSDRLRWEVLNRIHRVLNARNERTKP